MAGLEIPDETFGIVGLGECGAARCGKLPEELYLRIGDLDVDTFINWRTFRWIEKTGGDPDKVVANAHGMSEDGFLLTADGDRIVTSDGEPLHITTVFTPGADERVRLSYGTRDNAQFVGHLQRLDLWNNDPASEPTGRRVTMHAVGIERDMRRFLVSGVYTGSASEVVKAMVEEYTNGTITTNGVKLGARSVGTMSFKQVPLPVALDRVSEQVGWQWNMNVFDVQFFDWSEEPEVRPVNERGWGWYYRSLRADRDVSQLRNRVFVEGAGGTVTESVEIGENILSLTAVEVFEQSLEADWPWYVQGDTLMESTAMLNADFWFRDGAIEVEEVRPPYIEGGQNARAVRLTGAEATHIEETILLTEAGLHTVVIAVKQASAETTKVTIRDDTLGTDVLDARVQWDAVTLEPSVTMAAGVLHRVPVVTTPADPTGWWVFVCQVDIINPGNPHQLRFFPVVGPGTESSEWYIPGVQLGDQYALPCPVEYELTPRTGQTFASRSRRMAWIGNQPVIYRWAYQGAVPNQENWAAFSYQLDRWVIRDRVDVFPDVATDTDGNPTLERFEWDGTASGNQSRYIGADSYEVRVEVEETESDGTFAMQLDVKQIGPDLTDGVWFAFFVGDDAHAATNIVYGSFNVGTGANITTGTGPDNPGPVTVDAVDRGAGLWTFRISGQLAGFQGGDLVTVGAYAANAAGDPLVTPNTDGYAVVMGRVGLERGTTWSEEVISTGPVGVSLSGEVQLIGGIPGFGRFALRRNYPVGADAYPWAVVEDQASILTRATQTAGSWIADGPVEFFKRDRRLNAQGMETSARLDLEQYVGPIENALPEGTYRTRDRTVAAGRTVTVDVRRGWGYGPVRLSINRVTTTWRAPGLIERECIFGVRLPRTFFDLLQDTKRYTVEEE